MKWIAIAFLLPVFPALAQDNSRDDPSPTSSVVRPPVLRNAETNDSIEVMLPGGPVRPRIASVPPTPPTPTLAEVPLASAHTSAPRVPPPDRPMESAVPDPDHRPVLRRAPRPVLPAEFERDSAAFTQKLIGAWTEADAYNLFGDSLRQRPSYGDDGVENGRIVAYSDPTGRYRELELDFTKENGTLRTVFVYPWKLTWDQCRRQWGGNVQATSANKGRKFYSYVDRRLDVLVDPTGVVISLGLY
jgi:hypothetical protein